MFPRQGHERLGGYPVPGPKRKYAPEAAMSAAAKWRSWWVCRAEWRMTVVFAQPE